jgi:hypothetical protein
MSEVMVVPMARSRMSNNPKLPKKGKGFMDALKSVGRVVAPMAIDAGRKMIKDKYGFGVDLSQAQIRSLKKGGAIQIKPSQILEEGKQILQLLPQSAKKLMGALGKSKGMRLLLKEGEDVVDRLSGGSIFGVLGRLASSLLGGDGIRPAGTRGQGVFGDMMKKGLKVVAPMVVDAGADMLKKKMGGARAGVSKPYRDTMAKHSQGGGFFGDLAKKGLATLAPMAIDAGAEFLKKKVSGRGIFPAGGAVMPSYPTQLGSPYQSMSSPAMNPFVGTTGLSGYAPISAGSRRGGAMIPMDGIMKASRSRMVGTKPSTYTPAYISM